MGPLTQGMSKSISGTKSGLAEPSGNASVKIFLNGVEVTGLFISSFNNTSYTTE